MLTLNHMVGLFNHDYLSQSELDDSTVILVKNLKHFWMAEEQMLRLNNSI